MVKNEKILRSSVKIGVALAALFAVTQCVFAITGFGFFSGGEDKGKKGTNSFSDIKSSVTFSIKDTYGISSKEAFTQSHNKALSSSGTAANNSIVTYRKGNVVYILPYKGQKGVKMPGFISLSPNQKVPLNR